MASTEVSEMGVIEDILNVLDRIPKWKRVQELPDQVNALQRRLSDLEQKFAGKWPPDVCRYCGERAVRLHFVFGGVDDKGNVHESWKCEACKHVDERVYKPSTR